jgi:hypothetical protein
VTTSLGITLRAPSARAKNRRAAAASPGREQHVDDQTTLVDGSIDVAPDPVDLDVGLLDEPPIAW